MYISLYRKYRPGRFSDVVGQEGIVKILRNSLRSKKIGHAFLFSGPRGCGKTTVARIVAKALNCPDAREGEPCDCCEVCKTISRGESLDVIEIDGASNRGIEEIRNLKSQIGLASFSLSYKVYIIDEVHMLTDAAFNALLKTLEEPPQRVVFILATTAPEKVPLTIRSRCLRFYFNRLSSVDIVNRLRRVAQEESFDYEEEALWELARQADGSLRDALTLLEQALSLEEKALTLNSVVLLFGGSRSTLEDMVKLMALDPSKGYAKMREILKRGLTAERLFEIAFSIFRDMWAYKALGDEVVEELELSEKEKRFLEEETSSWDTSNLFSAMELCADLSLKAKLGVKDDILASMFFARTKKMEQAVISLRNDVQEHVKEPEIATTESSRDEVDVQTVNVQWQKIMNQLIEEALPIYCALISSKVERGEGEVVIEVSEERAFDYNILKLHRNRVYLYDLISRHMGEISEIVVKSGKEEIRYSKRVPDAEDIAEKGQIELLQPEEDEGKVEVKREEPLSAEAYNVKEDDAVLKHIAMFLNGDVLMYKRTEEDLDEDGGVDIE
ncbi:DNA polymerase III subunit gamma/tau [Acetomicrobium hydrogeniformans]|uniref:DNA polymerase III subunit gamma/tau n=1 Tax=Acetomicrobium hydrogeniformans TaxID=649746 RepID=A0A7V6ZCT9_9BACT|nr:DNA polymerase III subunit gamma/tau [Acetomicrobium hydrogeniformans]HHZ03589.1 DNA polymerase III subunit gamma/tau [Acetomicrobium hydrogeniformans]